jgi:hypothetical protein
MAGVLPGHSHGLTWDVDSTATILKEEDVIMSLVTSWCR